MSTLLDTEAVSVVCPYCAEPLDILVDPADPAEQYIEDCQVCCRPITMKISRDGGQLQVEALAEDEY